MTPFEAFHGRKPDVKHLRAFRCVSYAHIEKVERRKLDSVAKCCILVGYSSEVKGYRLYDPSCGKVFFSRSVKFNESKFGLEKESASTEPRTYVDLEVSSEETLFGEDLEPYPDQEPTSIVEASEPAVRRSIRVKRRPEYYIEGASVVRDGLEEPATVKEAFSSREKDE